MKVLLIDPPFHEPKSIYGSIPILLGQLKGNDIKANAIDLNFEFISDILKPDYLKKTINELKNFYLNKSKILYNSKEEGNYCLSEEQLNKQLTLIEKFIFKHKKLTEEIIDKAYKFFQSYNSLNNTEITIIFIALTIAFIPYYPNTLIKEKEIFFKETNPLYKFTYKDLVDRCSNSKSNIYIKYFKNKIKEYNVENYDIIGITVPFLECLYPALTLSKILKEKTNAKIILGGITINTIKESFIKHPEMFGQYFDVLMTGDGEKAIIDYTHYVEGKLPIKNISGLIYNEQGKIKQNTIEKISDINLIEPPSLDGILSKHKEEIIYLEFQKGCYWSKCSFCYNNSYKKYYLKNPSKAVDIIESLINEYNINNFSIVDDALNINFAEEFAQEIIKRNLNINYQCLFRFENILTMKKLKKLKQSGLTGIFFGLESASERILKLMNKGIDLKIAERILKDTYNAGISSNVGFIVNFPGETEEDFLKTINFIEHNKEYISRYAFNQFTLLKNSQIAKNKEKFQITDIDDSEEFSNIINYNSDQISIQRIKEIRKEHNLL